MIQGRGDGRQWVTKFVLSYSDDAYTWKFTNDIYGKKKVRYIITYHSRTQYDMLIQP